MLIWTFHIVLHPILSICFNILSILFVFKGKIVDLTCSADWPIEFDSSETRRNWTNCMITNLFCTKMQYIYRISHFPIYIFITTVKHFHIKWIFSKSSFFTKSHFFLPLLVRTSPVHVDALTSRSTEE